jgi:hypothetical protein
MEIILESVQLYLLHPNVDENSKAIRSMMKQFHAKTSQVSISELERQIWSETQEIDELVYTLYRLRDEDKEMLRQMYRCQTTSDFFDRLEEYVGFEDRDIEP